MHLSYILYSHANKTQVMPKGYEVFHKMDFFPAVDVLFRTGTCVILSLPRTLERLFAL